MWGSAEGHLCRHGRKDHSFQICVVLLCERRTVEDTNSRTCCVSDISLSCDCNKEVDLHFLTGLCLSGDAFSSDLPSAIACLLFTFPRLWSSCLNAHVAPLEHEPSDDHSWKFHRFPSPLFFHWCDWDSCVFHTDLFPSGAMREFCCWCSETSQTRAFNHE